MERQTFFHADEETDDIVGNAARTLIAVAIALFEVEGEGTAKSELEVDIPLEDGGVQNWVITIEQRRRHHGGH
jgi:hypothetical protein